MDVTARLLAKYVEKATGDKILVNNRTGGAGMVGHTYLATQAKPDGYTVGVLANLVWGDAMLRAQGKWAYTDLEPIGYLNTDALTWVGPTDGPLKGKTLKEIVQIAKDKPGTIRIATVPGSMWEYLVEQVEAATGAKFLRVPFQGGGAGINALAGGNVDIAQGFFAEFRGLLDAGKVAPLAVASGERMPYLKDMPTFNEALGGKDYIWAVIRFVVVPKGTPADRKAYLAAGVKAAMADPGARRRVPQGRCLLRSGAHELRASRRRPQPVRRARARVLPADRPAEVGPARLAPEARARPRLLRCSLPPRPPTYALPHPLEHPTWPPRPSRSIRCASSARG